MLQDVRLAVQDVHIGLSPLVPPLLRHVMLCVVYAIQ